MAKFKKGDIVRMKPEVLNEFDRDGIWHFHETLRGKELTVAGIEVYGSTFEWTDYILEETPFVLAEQWLELVRKAEKKEEEEKCNNDFVDAFFFAMDKTLRRRENERLY